ncbi:DEAD/DEAH box helicase domain protein [Chthoniobacter flavus Ellin428]|uniref:DEAD/DEAH box helicase domain protein n=1 Tax=Chthoniobacter flavus Ellin428 TaxID=497964 RepID=B4CXG3_9BACT|nr:DEAD/DEAH box helicase [Chthoniobacter flavus]EDY20961.1 DEAD/DEAH box helicase domain protein [Chthoniobacter flavus Ellin428]TCO88690.1 helicase-like protein [Chthoniobacter flavus]
MTPLLNLIATDRPLDNGALLGRFLEFVEGRKLQLYPAQETAILELFDEKNVILNTPTGSGKSLVATALHLQSLARGRRSVYTCPIKALVNEKWLALCREFGAENVGLSTGDATVNREAPILCCTAEILAKIALLEGATAPVHDVVMDEFHYYADRERGTAWQVPLLTLPHTRFLLMSATLGDTTFFEEELTRLNGRETVTVASKDRPVPLEFSYAETPLAQTLEALLTGGKGPVYVVHFTQADAAQSAQDFMSTNVCTREEKAAIGHALEGFKFSSPYGPEIKKWLRHGIGLHHAGLLPKYRVLVEQLAQRGLLKVICGTDTLGVGINVPIRTVLFTQLCKFSGQKTGILSARDFHQISGRAGRKGFDDVGWVVAQAPAHVIENLQLEQKQAASGKKFVKRKPPERNFVNWDKQTFARLMAAPPERLTSQFQVDHGMLLNVLSRPGDGCQAMRELIARCHEPAKAKKALTRRAWQLFRALVERGIIEFIPQTPEGAKVRVNVALQEDFSMNQTLSLYVHDTLPLMDPQAPDYALVVLTLVESILEDPELILRRQLGKVKDRAIAEMKMQGIEYNQRMEELEKLEYPKPNRDFIYATFNAFAARHPWVGQENIRPKSIAREMFEEFRSFAEYVKLYELQRAEGLLLRHLSSVYKALAQTVPDAAKNDTLREMELYLATMLRQIDSSLLEEWEKMRDPNYRPRDEQAEVRPPGSDEAAADITRDPKAFTAAIRNRIFSFLRAVVSGDFDTALTTLEAQPAAENESWTPERLRQAWEAYYVEHETLRLDPEARNVRHTYVTVSEDRKRWRVQQMLIDPAEANDWVAEFDVDLAGSRAAGEPALRLLRLGSLV